MTVNENYFQEIDTFEKAYWLGFIWADGCITWNEKHGNYCLSIMLQADDVEHIALLEKDLGGNRIPTVEIVSGRYTGRRLVWWSRKLAQSLIKHGITPRKSFTETIPKIPYGFQRDFWRGVFDGDGMITIQTKSGVKLPEYRLSLAGNRLLLETFLLWASITAGSRPQKIVRAKNQYGETATFKFEMSGNRQIEALTGVMYDGATHRLQRKYDIHLSLVEQNKRVKPSYKRLYGPQQ